MENNTWIASRINDLEIGFLRKIFDCRSPDAVEAAVTYARFMASRGVTPENCPVFLSILEIRNTWVVKALVGDQDPFEMLSKVQPNAILLRHIFRMLDSWPRGEISPINLSVILGALQSNYASPHNGYRLYPLSLAELNSLGKHLDKSKGQGNLVNRSILNCLDKLSNLENPKDPAKDLLATQALAIRGAFFDDRRRMVDVIPEVLLNRSEKLDEVAPRGTVPYSEGTEAATAAAKKKRRTAATRR